jgi:tRNA(adenine34) deaminase
MPRASAPSSAARSTPVCPPETTLETTFEPYLIAMGLRVRIRLRYGLGHMAPDPHEEEHHGFMRLAIEEARKALHLGEVPIGAVLVQGGEVVGSGFNQPRHTVDPTAHAEIVALRAAARAVGNYRLTGTTLYVTLEPCLMCVGALVNARLSAVVYGAAEPKWGALRSILDAGTLRTNHRFEIVGGVLEEECRALVVDFFKYRREKG